MPLATAERMALFLMMLSQTGMVSAYILRRERRGRVREGYPAKRAIDPILVEESAIFSAAPAPARVAGLAAIAALAKWGVSGVAMAA